MTYQIPKGLFDILPYGVDQEWKLIHYWHFVESVIHDIVKDYGYKELRTPIFERTELFHHGMGQTTDVVSKEMYTFFDRAQRSMSLRPEGTAALMRAFIEHKLNTLGEHHKFYYCGPMFRYERPQSGRYRQHHQFGVEAVGDPSPYLDAEVIDLLLQFYDRLGIVDLSIRINSLGTPYSRSRYAEALKKYLHSSFQQLSKESQERFSKNPLRILDSKDPHDQLLLKKAPSLLDYLEDSEKHHFDVLCRLLTELNISFTIDPLLVRGFDYYDSTVFEVISHQLGAQNAIGGGGRYNHLLESFHGPHLPGIGFATGLERVIQTMISQGISVKDQTSPWICFIALEEQAFHSCFFWAMQLRHKKISSEVIEAKKIQKGLQKANHLQARYAAILGEEEMRNNTIILKDLLQREQQALPMASFLKTLEKLWTEQ
ncbi:MAG: histidine--tRNA ligase [Parachlamydiales bacterium]|nr:histidine--tRNA ligase [Parachlamydiales bacterium]